MTTHPTTTIDFLRHGEPLGGQKYRGTLDDPLSPLGWKQMQKTLDDHPAPWQRIISSPLIRCAQFAAKTAEERSIPFELEPGFREMGFGLWEGKSKKELLEDKRYRIPVQNFWKNPLANTPPGGESIQAVHDRVAVAWQIMLEQYRGEHLLFIAHSGVIRVALGMLLGIPLTNLSRLLVPYAALSRVRIEQIGDTPIPRLIFFHADGLDP
ncbi:MAG: histidine phosphatase family protein [Magnetococcales bacterium]|nr:histidine phosphatase family protein [Magnetococcales bacterium]